MIAAQANQEVDEDNDETATLGHLRLEEVCCCCSYLQEMEQQYVRVLGSCLWGLLQPATRAADRR